MRKIVFAFVILLLTAPTWAVQEVECNILDVPGPNYVIAVNYNIDDGNEFRAFGIRVDVNNGAVISDIDVNDTDYYIFPGDINIPADGNVNNIVWGSAVAEGGNGQSYMILEMGSLYDEDDPCHKTAPPSSGRLCTFKVSKECVVSLTEDSDRGGVVLANTSKSYSGTPQGCTVPYDNCFPQLHDDWEEYDAMGRPDCWCYPRQCYGDATGTIHKQMGLPHQFWVGVPDLTILSIGWKLADTDPNFSTFICADFTHSKHKQMGIPHTFRCGVPDLTILSTYWKGPNPPNPAPDTNCLTVY